MCYVIYDLKEKGYITQREETGFFITQNLFCAEMMRKKPDRLRLDIILRDMQKEYEAARYEIQTINMCIIDTEAI